MAIIYCVVTPAAIPAPIPAAISDEKISNLILDSLAILNEKNIRIPTELIKKATLNQKVS